MPSHPAAPAIHLFGTPLIGPPGAERAMAAERAMHLLALLACRRTWVARDELAELLWPERGQRLARSNLRKLLQQARRLAEGAGLEERGDCLRWRPDSDLQRFEDALAAGALDAALAGYRGPLLQGLEAVLPPAAAEWLQFERGRWAAAWRRAAAQRLETLAPEPAAALAARVLEQDPFDEAALCALVRARLAQGRCADGLRALKRHAARLAEELGLAPSAAVRALERELRAPTGEPGAHDAFEPPAAAPELQRPGSQDCAVPAPALEPQACGSFVGRRLELAQVQALLRQPACRVLTLTGPGGVGKSSVARAALARLAPDFAAGILWLPLDDLTQAAQVPARIAETLGEALPGGGDAWQEVADRLGTGARLLVVDNSEHLAGLPALLGGLLAACPGLKLLNTSRSRLGLAGEWLLPLEGLPLPDADETDPDLLRCNDAVRLFEARARAAQPAFELAPQAADVVILVHAVEGLPLAIVLAAAWVRLLPVREIVAELARSLDLLDAPGAPPARDRGLRASFMQSWRLLTVSERESLARLALLPGPFGREMAEQVAGCGLPMLAALADRSLLQADGQGRFSLHPLVRQCAAEQAAAGACDAEAVRALHAAFVARWLAGFEEFRRVDAGRAVPQIEQSLAHVRSAWDWAIAHREPQVVAMGALSLAQFYAQRRLLAEGTDTMRRACAAFDAGSPGGARASANAAFGLAHLEFRAGRFIQAEASARPAMKLAARLRDSRLVVKCLNLIGTALLTRGLHDAARPYLARGLAEARRAGHAHETGMLLGGLARVEKAARRYDEAARLMREALACARAGQPPNHEGVVLQTNNLANLHVTRGEWAQALVLFEEALAACETHAIAVHRPLILMNLGRAEHALGRMAAARRWATRAIDEARSHGRGLIVIWALQLQARLDIAEGSIDAARANLHEALALAGGMGLAAEQVRCTMLYAELLASQDEPARAAVLWAWAARQPQLPADDVDGIERSLRALGHEPSGTLPADPALASEAGLAGMVAWVAGCCRAAALVV